MLRNIESQHNPLIKNLIKLREAGRERKRQGLFLIEGWREINLALKGGVEIVNLFYCRDYIKQELEFDEEKLIEVSKKVFAKISYRENPDGFLAVAKFREIKLENIELSPKPLIIILEAVEKPGNLGAILRTADAAGADAVIINDPKTDIYNPNVIRASQGTVFTVPVVLNSIDETINFCKSKKIKILATTPDTKKEYIEVDYNGGCAIVMGAEDKGLSDEWLASANEKIKIKMRGIIDSLNVSVSTAIILFEAVRQRNNK
ncbi:MAG: RNA methyltransferase [Patescibacteria group bacterium]|nr:RNA methyltransferase [Patescibacteria group bacterium]